MSAFQGLIPSLLAAQATVEVKVATTGGAWYTEPKWIWLGAIVFCIVVLLAFASRGSGRKTRTTIR